MNLVLQTTILKLELGNIEGAIDKQLEHVGVDGFFVKVVGALRDGGQCVFLVTVAGDDDYFCIRCKFEYLAKCLQALFDTFGFGRQSQVLQHDRGFVATQLDDRGFTVLCCVDIVILETPLELAQQPGVVFDDE